VFLAGLVKKAVNLFGEGVCLGIVNSQLDIESGPAKLEILRRSFSIFALINSSETIGISIAQWNCQIVSEYELSTTLLARMRLRLLNFVKFWQTAPK